MRVTSFLHKMLEGAIHQSRIKLLTVLVEGVLKSKCLKLSSLGRSLTGIQERSGIRKVDKFLANAFFQQESMKLYGTLIKCVLGTRQRPVILVDWSKLPNVNSYVLRASYAAEGRAITLYEEVHPKSSEGKAKVHVSFLERLHRLLPPGCSALIVTDAGFKNPWFKAVEKLGWDFIGRVRGKTHCGIIGEFQACETLHRQAHSTPCYLGEKLLAKKAPLAVGFYVVRQKRKGRKRYTRSGKICQDKDSKNYARSYREPWVLVSSIKRATAAKKIVKLYARRMSIEEAFRDIKSSQYGFGLEENHTLNPARLIVWLFLAALTLLLAWVTGYMAEKYGLHYQFQVNSIKHRRVLSYVYLGCQIMRRQMAIPMTLRHIQFVEEEIFI